MTGRRRAAGALESEVLRCLWASDLPMTAGDIVVDLGGSLAYNTVQTILIRLLRKNAVTRDLAGRAHVYTAVLDDAGLAAHRMRGELHRGADRDAVLSRFVAALSEDEQAALRTILRSGDPHA